MWILHTILLLGKTLFLTTSERRVTQYRVVEDLNLLETSQRM